MSQHTSKKRHNSSAQRYVPCPIHPTIADCASHQGSNELTALGPSVEVLLVRFSAHPGVIDDDVLALF